MITLGLLILGIFFITAVIVMRTYPSLNPYWQTLNRLIRRFLRCGRTSQGRSTAALPRRLINILFRPKEEWQIINAEKTTIACLYLSYIIPLTALWPVVVIPAAIIIVLRPSFGNSIVTGPYFNVMPVYEGLWQIVFEPIMVGYVTTLILAFAMARFVNIIAPTFSGEKDQIQALKLVTYAGTPVWLALVFISIGTLGIGTLQLNMFGVILALILSSIYAVYLLYLGLPILMKTPQEKVPFYLGDLVIVFLFLAWVFNSLKPWRWRRGMSLLQTWYIHNQDVAHVVLVVITFVGLAIFFGGRKNHSAN